MYNSEHGELEFDFHLRQGKFSFFIKDEENGSRRFTVVEPNNIAHNFPWETESVPSIEDVRIWILLGMPELPAKKSLNSSELKRLSLEKLRRL